MLMLRQDSYLTVFILGKIDKDVRVKTGSKNDADIDGQASFDRILIARPSKPTKSTAGVRGKMVPH